MAKWKLYGHGFDGETLAPRTGTNLEKAVARKVGEQVYSCRDDGAVGGRQQYVCTVGKSARGGGFNVTGHVTVRYAGK
jgi:hypothetical protein